MSEFIYKDYLPLNARILIDYNQPKGEKVKFSYPIEMTYKQAVIKRALPTIFTLWFIILFYSGFIYGLFYILFNGINTLLHLNLTNFINNFFTIKTTTYTVSTSSFYSTTSILYIITFGILLVLGIPLIITYYLARDKNRLARWIPKFGYWSSKLAGFMKEIEFTSKDITKENMAILPIFNNVFLKWFPTNDFNKYLKKIEILEIPFNYKKKYLIGKYKRQYNDYLFRAIFLFKKKPIKGSLKVEFM